MKFTIQEALEIGGSIGMDFDEEFSIEQFIIGYREEWSEHMEGDGSIFSYLKHEDEAPKVIALMVKRHLEECAGYYDVIADALIDCTDEIIE